MSGPAKGSIAAALENKRIARAIHQLEGCPVGGWGETRAAKWGILNELPRHRSYTLSELIDVAFDVDPVTRRYKAKQLP